MPPGSNINLGHAARDEAFQCRRRAFDTMEETKTIVATALREMNQARDDMNAANAENSRQKQLYRTIKSANEPRIVALRTKQEAAYKNMSRAFETSRRAYAIGNSAAARSNSVMGNRWKDQAQQHVSKRHRLIEENDSAAADYVASNVACLKATAAYDSAKRAYIASKAAYGHAKTAFNTADAALNEVDEAFSSTYGTVQAGQQERSEYQLPVP